MNVAEAKMMADLESELRTRREILDAIAKQIGEGNSWLSVATAGWKEQLRDFAADGEQHRISRKEWRSLQGNGVTLFLQGNFATAYFDDANILWSEADNDLPMFHCMVKSDPPHRTCIHLLHLVNWVAHLAGKCVPVQIVDMQFVEGDE